MNSDNSNNFDNSSRFGMLRLHQGDLVNLVHFIHLLPSGTALSQQKSLPRFEQIPMRKADACWWFTWSNKVNWFGDKFVIWTVYLSCPTKATDFKVFLFIERVALSGNREEQFENSKFEIFSPSFRLQKEPANHNPSADDSNISTS